MQALALLAAVWALIGAPALCRAAAMAGCCDANLAPPNNSVIHSACCSERGAAPCDSPNGPPATPRECGSCADVCRGNAKPNEERLVVGFLDSVQPSHQPDGASYPANITAACGATCQGAQSLAASRRLASGAPLRI